MGDLPFPEMRLLAGSANPPLAERIAAYLGMPLAERELRRFTDGEIFFKVKENVRGLDVFIIQPTHPPADNLMELLIMLDACRRASAQRITAVIPYYGYARQDRKDQPRVPITAKLVANLITHAGANRVLTMDLHSAQIQGFFDIELDHLFAAPVLLEEMRRHPLKDLTVVAPDMGSVKMGRAFAKRLGADLAIVDKRRPRPDAAEVMNIIGQVQDRDVVILDDIVNTASTLTEAARSVREAGARSVRAACSHAVLSGPSLERINESDLTEVLITNSIPYDHGDACPKIRTVDVSGLLGEGIRRIHVKDSLSSLFV
jgi:ribose-phosphate pyrophosphokinase